MQLSNLPGCAPRRLRAALRLHACVHLNQPHEGKKADVANFLYIGAPLLSWKRGSGTDRSILQRRPGHWQPQACRKTDI